MAGRLDQREALVGDGRGRLVAAQVTRHSADEVAPLEREMLANAAWLCLRAD